MKVFLIGFMGSGKTTAAKKLAEALNCGWLDMDQWIERDTGMSIPWIFEQQGELAFRDLEYRYLRRMDHSIMQVVATGGGTPCHHGNMEYMNKKGWTVYLKMSPEQLYSRLKDQKGHRPKLMEPREENLKDYIIQKIRDRAPYYEKAHIQVPGYHIDIPELAEQIRTRMKQ